MLYLIMRYPNFSETYMHEEMRAVQREFDIRVISLDESKQPRERPFPYEVIRYQDPDPLFSPMHQVNVGFDSPEQQAFLGAVGDVIESFRPDVLHGHYFGMALPLHALAERHGIPFTVRTHSQDILNEPAERIAAQVDAATSEWCLGLLAYPAFVERLVDAGLPPEKVVACWPLINFARFYIPERRAPTGRVMCGGPATKKKAHRDFVALAAEMRDSGLQFDLYARGMELGRTRALNEKSGSPVRITYADPDEMAAVYASHDWLVYPADREINKVGLPASIAEAQAGGVGVCWQELPGRRAEQLDYLGGAGFLFKSIEDIPEIISQPYPEEMRRCGLENARKCDVQGHIHLLTNAWREA